MSNSGEMTGAVMHPRPLIIASPTRDEEVIFKPRSPNVYDKEINKDKLILKKVIVTIQHIVHRIEDNCCNSIITKDICIIDVYVVIGYKIEIDISCFD